MISLSYSIKARSVRGLERALIFGILLVEISRGWMNTKRQYYVQHLRDRIKKSPANARATIEQRSHGNQRTPRFSSSEEFQARSKKKPREQD
jgi:hypothetical protein